MRYYPSHLSRYRATGVPCSVCCVKVLYLYRLSLFQGPSLPFRRTKHRRIPPRLLDTFVQSLLPVGLSDDVGSSGLARRALSMHCVPLILLRSATSGLDVLQSQRARHLRLRRCDLNLDAIRHVFSRSVVPWTSSYYWKALFESNATTSRNESSMFHDATTSRSVRSFH